MNILSQLLQIITLKRRPQDIDFDEFSAIFYVVAAIGLGYVLLSLTPGYSKPLQYSLVQNLTQAATLYGILAINQKQSRFIQTCTTLFGISVIMQILVLGVQFIPGLALLSLFLQVWVFYLTILIMREALDSNTLIAVFVTIALGFVSLMAVVLIFPDFIEEFIVIFEAAQNQAAAT